MRIIGQDFYNTDGNGLILIVEREDHWYAEARDGESDFVGADAGAAAISGATWHDSPNDVIEAWYRTFRDHGQLIRPNTRPQAAI